MDPVVVKKQQPSRNQNPPEGMRQPTGQRFERLGIGGGGSQKKVSNDETQSQQSPTDSVRDGEQGGERKSINLKVG